jgi:hypothetical protein
MQKERRSFCMILKLQVMGPRNNGKCLTQSHIFNFQFLFGETLNNAYAGKYRVRFFFCRQFLKREKEDFAVKGES